jgi:LmbE family N-acetylglucosaminyl deacetylase
MDDRLNLILSPHFDDAVLSLGGLIAKMPERAIVITVFAGTPAESVTARWDRRSGFASAAEAMHARSIENDRALAVLGVPKRAICSLDHIDDQYRRLRHSGKEPEAQLRSAIARDVRRLLADHQNRVNLFAPASAWHPDHRIVTDAVLELRRDGDCRDAEIFLYQDQPYAYLELRRKTLFPLKFADFAVLDDTARERAAQSLERFFIDLKLSEISRKTESIGLYRSQFRRIRACLQKMIADFSYYQARNAGLAELHAEVVYKLLAQ